MEQRPSSKLAVILHADVVGSTGLVQRDETKAHERIQNAFRHFSEIIQAYKGITLEIRGDALLAQFDRASAAVSAALAFQSENAQANTALDDDIQAVVRIGISLGEVLIADGTITGEGVVIAQRLEQLAEPGGVNIQGAAYETVPRRLPFEYMSLGEKTLKGFSEPVRIFSVRLKPESAVPAPEEPQSIDSGAPWWEKRWFISGLVGCLAISALAGIFWLKPWDRQQESATADLNAPTGIETPSIAVLPFANLSGDPGQEYFSDGITNDIITDLAKSPDLIVIASNSSFTYKGKAVKVQQVGKELGVKYVLEGSVQKSGDSVRINVQLIDAATGGHLWAERFESTLEDVFALQDSVSQEVVLKIPAMMITTNQQPIKRGETANPMAYDAFLKGWQAYRRQTPESFAQARDHFEQAISLDPDYSRAHGALAALYWRAHQRVWYYALGTSFANMLAMEHLEKASEVPTALTHMVTAEIRMKHGEYGAALTEAEQAVEFAPNDPEARNTLAQVLIYSGKPQVALEHIEHALRLDPANRGYALFLRGLAEFGLDRFESAAKDLAKALQLNPDFRRPAAILAAAYGFLDKEREARAALEEYESEYPAYGITSTVLSFPYLHETDKSRLTEGLRRVGMQVKPYTQ